MKTQNKTKINEAFRCKGCDKIFVAKKYYIGKDAYCETCHGDLSETCDVCKQRFLHDDLTYISSWNVDYCNKCKEEVKNYYKDEKEHTHFCVDEFISSLILPLKSVQEIWTKNKLGCKRIKEELDEVFSESNNPSDFSEKLENYAKALKKLFK